MTDVQQFLILGYQDYIASRFLLNNNYVIQGVTLASSAVEKYLKALLIIAGGKIRKVHLDRKEELHSLFSNTPLRNIFDPLDDTFIHIIGRSYAFRYYDNIKERETIGFIINQFLCELDFTINLFEKIIVIENNDWQTPYRINEKNKINDLFLNNFLFTGIEKKDFMLRDSYAFGICYDPKYNSVINIGTTTEIKVIYPGNIMSINLKYEDEE